MEGATTGVIFDCLAGSLKYRYSTSVRELNGNYNWEFPVAFPQTVWLFMHYSRFNCNLEMLVSAEGEKPENQAKNPWSKARPNNKFDLHMMPGSGIGAKGVFSPLPFPSPHSNAHKQ